MTEVPGSTSIVTAPVPAPVAPIDATTATDGVAGGGAPSTTCCTGFDAAPVQTGDAGVIPAPSTKTDDTEPPAPIEVPDAAPGQKTDGAGRSGTTAAARPTWPAWEQAFAALGLQPDAIAAIGATDLTDEELGGVYADVQQGLAVPGDDSTDSAWDGAWEQRFRALGLPSRFVAALQANAQATGADDAKLERVYRDLVLNLNDVLQRGGPAGKPVPTAPAPTKPATPVEPGQKPPATADGWSDQYAAKFAALGMPDEIQQQYAQAGLSAAALDRLYEYAAERKSQVEATPYGAKFAAAQASPDYMWGIYSGTDELGNDPLHTLYNGWMDQKWVLDHMQRTGEAPGTVDLVKHMGGQVALNLVPGARTLQYLRGTTSVSDKEIDRSKPAEIAGAAVSAIAAGAAALGLVRGHGNVAQGLRAWATGFEHLGLAAGTDAKLSQRLLTPLTSAERIRAFVPFTAEHRQVVALGHEEAAARLFNEGGSAMLRPGGDETLQSKLLASHFRAVAEQPGLVTANGNGYLPRIMKFAARDASAPYSQVPRVDKVPVAWNEAAQRMTFQRGIGSRSGAEQLVGILQGEAARLSARGADTAARTTDHALVDGISGLSLEQRASLPWIAASGATRDLAEHGLGASRTDVRMAQYLRELGRTDLEQGWYRDLAARMDATGGAEALAN